MNKLEVSAFDMAQRFVGIKEISGTVSNAQILAMLRLDNDWPAGDDVAWCSAFVNYVAWLLRLPRSKSLSARSWLAVGQAVDQNPEVGFDVVVLKRGGTKQPGPEVLAAPGHVGFYAGTSANGSILVLGGNQGNAVNVTAFSPAQLLGIRRLL